MITWKEFRWVLLVLILLLPTITFVVLQYRFYCLDTEQNEVNSYKKGLTNDNPSVVTGKKPGKKILFMTASYSMKQYMQLWKVIEGYRDICEAGWDVDIAIQVSNGLNLSSIHGWQLEQSAYCHRLKRVLNMSFQSFDKIGFGLNSQHRNIIKQHIQEYDYFIYSEEDMLFTPHHLAAFVHHEQKLKKIFPRTWYMFMIGHLRYEEYNHTLSQVSWEYMPDKIHVIKLENNIIEDYKKQFPDEVNEDTGFYVVTNNLNQAFYIISRDQMQYLEDSCEFLSKPGRNLFMQQLRKALIKDWKYLSVGVSEWSSSFQQVLQCGLRRLIPMEHFQSFRLHHLTNVGHKRRLRKELLSTNDWAKLLAEKRKQPLSLDSVYLDIIYEQYNLHLLDYAGIEGKIKYKKWK